MQLVIDNTRTSGNFFDNILNNNMFVKLYNIKEGTELKDLINESDNFYFQENDYTLDVYDYMYKYDYVNNETLDNYINDEYEKLYNEKYKDMFTLTLSQFNQYINFCLEHKKCLVDIKTGKHRFGLVNNGIRKEFKIKNVEDNNLFLFKTFVKCLYCNAEIELINNQGSESDISDDIKNSYEIECKYGFKFDKVEFYRFMEIYNDHKNEDLTITFTNSGLGHVITVQTNEYIYNISNIDNW